MNIEETNIKGFRDVDSVPAGVPHVVAWFTQDGMMHWRIEQANSEQIAYLAARLLREAVEDE